MVNKICPYVQNCSRLIETYTYTEEGQVKTFQQDTFKGNALCVREQCAVWDEEKQVCNFNRK